MTENHLQQLRRIFSSYVRRFYTGDEGDQRNIALKEDHTERVCENIVQIAREGSLQAQDIPLVAAAALFHDVGRFPQYAQYGTFRDSMSVNHGKLGAEVLEQEGMLSSLTERERHLVIHSVRFHNAFALPDGSDETERLFLKMLRDADKLDIWRVFADYYESPVSMRASAAGLDLPDLPEYSGEVLRTLLNEKMVTLSMLGTLNDFRLLQLSWIYDLNFASSFRLLLKRKLIERISGALPPDERLADAVARVTRHARAMSGHSG